MIIACLILLAITNLALGFFLLGAIRTVHRLTWRLDQLEATTPRHIGRSGVALGGLAPAFELPDTRGQVFSMSDLRGRPVLLAFMQVGCEPCHEVIPGLNRLSARQRMAVVAIVHGTPAEVCEWVADAEPQFPTLVQETWDVSRRYEVFATPFAFVIDADGTVVSKGIISSPDYLELLLADADERGRPTPISKSSKKVALSPSAVNLSNA